MNIYYVEPEHSASMLFVDGVHVFTSSYSHPNAAYEIANNLHKATAGARKFYHFVPYEVSEKAFVHGLGHNRVRNAIWKHVVENLIEKEAESHCLFCGEKTENGEKFNSMECSLFWQAGLNYEDIFNDNQ